MNLLINGWSTYMTSKDPSAHINDTSSATYFPIWNLKLL